jgi:excisionase family DNA binding protein
MRRRATRTNSQTEPQAVLTVSEAADYLTLSRAQLYKLVRQGVFQPIKLGRRRVVFLREHLEAKLRELLAKQQRHGK